jgi:uncharacterized protein (TIGR03437 family)
MSGAFTLYPVASPNSQIESITKGPDGALWFTATTRNVGRITTSGAITFFPLPNNNSTPFNIVAGPDGNLWISDAQSGHVYRMTTAGVVTEFTPPPGGGGGSGTNDIAVGPDGALWAVSGLYLDRIATAGTYTAEYLLAGLPAQYLTVGPDGQLWFTDWQADRIYQVTTAGVLTYFSMTQGIEPWGMTAGADGALWITERHGNKIARMTISAAGPTILAGGIVNAASYAKSNGVGSPVAPGTLVAIFTSQLSTTAANFTTATLPPSLANVSVTFNGITAPMVSVSPGGQYPFVSAQVPFEIAPGTASVVVTVNNTPSPSVQETIVASEPGIFTIPATGQGNAILVFIDPSTNQPAIAGPSGAQLGYPTDPIPRGTGGFFYVTGLGAMSPSVNDGSGSCPAASELCYANAQPMVLVGGVPAAVVFAGQAPGFPGVDQINVTIPSNAPTGPSVSLVVKSADGTVTSNTATIAVQ